MLINNFNPRQRQYDEDGPKDYLELIQQSKIKINLPEIKFNINHPGGQSKRRLQYVTPSVQKLNMNCSPKDRSIKPERKPIFTIENDSTSKERKFRKEYMCPSPLPKQVYKAPSEATSPRLEADQFIFGKQINHDKVRDLSTTELFSQIQTQLD